MFVNYYFSYSEAMREGQRLPKRHIASLNAMKQGHKFATTPCELSQSQAKVHVFILAFFLFDGPIFRRISAQGFSAVAEQEFLFPFLFSPLLVLRITFRAFL